MGPKRDISGEIADSCRKNGLKFGFYFSLSEWEFPVLDKRGNLVNCSWNKILPYSADMEYKASGKIAVNDFVREYTIPQAVEFIDKYSPDILWYDADWSEKAAKLGLNMKPVDAEYTFDRSKLIFYFTAESRVDFRELVRALATIYKVRIELLQIYERDDAKMRGALAACGRPCCCTTHLPDFEKVSIKMAKVQGLSLNPQKISGVCGRLLCCLKYENDYYSEVFKKMPKVGSKVHTADGEGVVESNDLIKQTSRVRVLMKDGSYDVKTYALEDITATARQTEPDDSADPDAPKA